VADVAARVETIVGVIEPYRDTAGICSEWGAMIGIADPGETAMLKRFVDSSAVFLSEFPWAVDGEIDGKGLFEKNLFEGSVFYQCTRSATLTTSKFRAKPKLLALAVCGSIVFEAANLSNVCLNSIQPGRRALTLI
jgi:dipeptidyl-peptidase-3